jgi:cytochrome oxidase assembly protein ShyY1
VCNLLTWYYSAQAVKDFEYRRVKVSGVYDHTHEMLLGPRTRGDGNSGYFLITPLVRENGSIVLIKRGWVPTEKKDPRTRPESLTQDVQEVEGLLRHTEMVRYSQMGANDMVFIRSLIFVRFRQTRSLLTTTLSTISGIGWMWKPWLKSLVLNRLS